MITINYKRNRSVSVEGHAGAAPAGQDLVCAAVSALTYCLDAACAMHPEYGMKIKRVESLPYFSASVKLRGRKALRTVAEGLQLLAIRYPQFITFNERS